MCVDENTNEGCEDCSQHQLPLNVWFDFMGHWLIGSILLPARLIREVYHHFLEETPTPLEVAFLPGGSTYGDKNFNLVYARWSTSTFRFRC